MKPPKPDGNKFRFQVGVVLIAASYPLWAAAVFLGALQLRGGEFPWWRIAAAALVLNWLCFVSGILLAGREAVRYLHGRIRRFFTRASTRREPGVDLAMQRPE